MEFKGSKDMEQVKGCTYSWIALQTICTNFIPVEVIVTFCFPEP